MFYCCLLLMSFLPYKTGFGSCEDTHDFSTCQSFTFRFANMLHYRKKSGKSNASYGQHHIIHQPSKLWFLFLNIRLLSVCFLSSCFLTTDLQLRSMRLVFTLIVNNASFIIHGMRMMKRQKNLSRKIFLFLFGMVESNNFGNGKCQTKLQENVGFCCFFFFLLLTPVWMLLSLKLSLFVEDIVDDFELWALG